MYDIQMGEEIRYLINDAGEKTDVIVPVDVWKKIIGMIQPESGLDPIDEQEPVAQILADLKTSMRQAELGQTFPVSELWDGIDV